MFALVVIADAALHLAQAQGSLFSGQRSGASAPSTGIVGWLLEKQSEFYRQMSTTIRAAKTDGSAVWTLIGISFAYGIFHAAGPGHGKAVISSYLIANEETARRGVVLSFASALLQSLVAIVLVGLGRLVFNAAASTMCSAERAVEIASYGLIALVGARLVWTKGRSLLNAMTTWRGAALAPTLAPALAFEAAAHAHAGHDHGHHHHHDHHDHDQHGRAHHHDHDHSHDDPHHVHDEHCGHNHGPMPSELAGPGGWQRGFSAIVAAGLRPCSGAILVLVFAFAQGLFGAGIAATLAMGVGTAITVATIAVLSVTAKGFAQRLVAHREGAGMLLLRGLEFGAAGVVLLFGVALLSGYLVAERATCF
jgi:nickel/cobalt exporter